MLSSIRGASLFRQQTGRFQLGKNSSSKLKKKTTTKEQYIPTKQTRAKSPRVCVKVPKQSSNMETTFTNATIDVYGVMPSWDDNWLLGDARKDN